MFVAPTRFAAGIPHKVHQAAAFGVPSVTTSLLARQLGWEDGRDLLVADSPDGFASAVQRLYTDQDLWRSIRSNALKRIADDCSVERFREALRETLRGGVSTELRTAPSVPPTDRTRKTVGSKA
ncbi:glycosyltransferase [Tabrizicola sp.]|uniref:glycosyltransferase n=1 Tax=Tabrizicola sp. TaxID=2005166 RepID=UPI0035B29022